VRQVPVICASCIVPDCDIEALVAEFDLSVVVSAARAERGKLPIAIAKSIEQARR
jgi:hypothetical protein